MNRTNSKQNATTKTATTIREIAETLIDSDIIVDDYFSRLSFESTATRGYYRTAKLVGLHQRAGQTYMDLHVHERFGYSNMRLPLNSFCFFGPAPADAYTTFDALKIAADKFVAANHVA